MRSMEARRNDEAALNTKSACQCSLGAAGTT